jgi:hypothetical protein
MSKVDWSLAKDGYPFWLEDLNPECGGDMSGWHRDDGDRYTDTDGLHWLKKDSDDYTVYLNPSKQKQEWSGPQDGLPPVGVQVEIRNTKNRDCSPGSEDLFGKSVAVMAVFRNMHDYEIVAVEGDDGGCYCFRADMCFPVRTAEQLAAEQRETAIREIMDIADVDCRVTAARLVDAGFKREVV